MSYSWLTRAFLQAVLPYVQENPEIGRPTLSAEAGITMYQAEKLLGQFKRLDLYRHLTLDPAAALDAVAAALGADTAPVAPEQLDSDDIYHDDLEHDDSYYYDEVKDLYVATLKVKGKQVLANVPGAKHRAMLESYSHWDGDKATLNQIAKQHGVSRAWFSAYKHTYGWTHDSDPFTNEDVNTHSVSELAKNALQRKRAAVERRFVSLEDRSLREDAQRWRNLEVNVLNPLFELGAARSRSLPVPALNLSPTQGDFAFVLGTVDLHYGKYGWHDEVGDGYDRAEAKRRLQDCTERLLSRLLRLGTPSKLILPAANDWLHIDNHLGTTTRGTPQDLDGTPAQILDEGYDLFVHYLEMLEQVAPIDVLYIPDNHAKMLGQGLLKYAAGYFRNDPRVRVDTGTFPRKYRLVGNTLCSFEHDLRKATAAQMAGESRELWGRSEYAAAFGAHLHHEGLRSDDRDGVLIYKLPSMSGNDRYHTDQGYTLSRKSLGGYLIDFDEGVTDNMFAPVRSAA